ncbi:MAG: T9SS type A sorting domain-containing protein [Bacteroidales bacterium]|nr:T9SS type A sorting domain-containing protein [Bacteroidales bacterium]
MKKQVFVILVLMAGAMALPSARAQVADTMLVPFGCFEQWNNFPGDTMSLMGMPLPINGGYTLPEGWEIPRYIINDTFSYMGFPIPVNAEIPLAKVHRDSVNAPEGSSALVAETFEFADAIDPMTVSLAGSLLDSSLLHQMLPTIVSTGHVNVNEILPLLENIFGNTSELSWMLDILDTGDFNNYISGGFPLNGFLPGRLLGYYKYIYDHNNPDRDFGAVVALGTRYDTATHRRLVVGAGSKRLFQLYDTVNYEPFYMDYFPIGDYLPDGYVYSEPDSMVVMAISSVGDKGWYKGSRLFLDSLQLVQFAGPCGRIENLRDDYHDYCYVRIAWNNSASPDRWEVEYGRSGFFPGTGTIVTVTDSTYLTSELEANTTYDFYVHGLCGDSAETPKVFISITTDTLPRYGIGGVDESNITLYPNPSQGRCMVDFGGVKVDNLRLFSIDGRLVQELAVREDHIELELPNTGVFIVELQTAKGLLHKRLVNK